MSNESEIEWGELPPNNAGVRGATDWVKLLAPFRSRPNEWGKLPGTYPTSQSTRIKAGFVRGAKAGEFEAVTRNTLRDDQGRLRCDIWVRYVGGAS